MRKQTGSQPKTTFRTRLLTIGCITLAFLPVFYIVAGIFLFMLVVVFGGAEGGNQSPITGLFLNLYGFPVMIFLLCAFGLGALLSLRDTWLVRLRGNETTGTITQTYWDEETHKATVRFTAQNGTSYQTDVVLLATNGPYQEGYPFPVRYDPRNPARARSAAKRTTLIGRIMDGMGIVIVELIIVTFALGWLGMGLAFLYGFLAQWLPGLPH